MLTQEEPTTLQQELREIQRSNDGLLAPVNVVSWAEQHPESALHRQFQWDDTEAAKQYRLHQARQIILRVKLTIEAPKEKVIRVREFVSLREDRKPEGGYRSTIDVMADPERRAILLREAMTELQTFKRKYEHLSELAGVITAIDQMAKPKAS